jgi:dolichyl-phosphate-mannose--protein O-mannosyl transferase
MIFVYFFFLEIIPMSVIIFIIQKTSQSTSEDSLPSAFNSFVTGHLGSLEAANNLVSRLFSLPHQNFAAFETLKHPNSLPLRINHEENIEEKKRLHSLFV